MAKKTAKRVKHVPQRTCVGCRQTLAKRSLIRIVRTPEGLRVDPTGKLPGRGAYLHDRRSCWENGIKGALAHALNVELTDLDRETFGVFTLFAVLFIFIGAQFIGMGLLGEYLGRVYHDVRARPRYFVDKITGRSVQTPPSS